MSSDGGSPCLWRRPIGGIRSPERRAYAEYGSGAKPPDPTTCDKTVDGGRDVIVMRGFPRGGTGRARRHPDVSARARRVTTTRPGRAAHARADPTPTRRGAAPGPSRHTPGARRRHAPGAEAPHARTATAKSLRGSGAARAEQARGKSCGRHARTRIPAGPGDPARSTPDGPAPRAPARARQHPPRHARHPDPPGRHPGPPGRRTASAWADTPAHPDGQHLGAADVPSSRPALAPRPASDPPRRGPKRRLTRTGNTSAQPTSRPADRHWHLARQATRPGTPGIPAHPAGTPPRPGRPGPPGRHPASAWADTPAHPDGRHLGAADIPPRSAVLASAWPAARLGGATCRLGVRACFGPGAAGTPAPSAPAAPTGRVGASRPDRTGQEVSQARPGKKILISRAEDSSESDAWIRFSRTITP